MVFAAADPNKDMLLIDRNVRWLESKQVTEADRKGAWSYPGPGGDNSNSQFAVLAPVRRPERRREGKAADLATRRRLLAEHRRTTTALGATCRAMPVREA